MLVLSRHRDETIVITAPDGTRLALTVVDIRGDKVRIGIAAPVDYAIHRGEVQSRVDAGEPWRRKGGDATILP